MTQRVAFLILFSWTLVACGQPIEVAIETAVASATATIQPSATVTPSPIPTQAAPIPATVSVGQASCRVGPGGAYLLVDVLREGEAIEILGAMEMNNNWILIETSDSTNCWINTELVQASQDGPFNPIQDPHVVMPMSSYYSPLRNVIATRTGNVVRVRWDPLLVREDDRSLQIPYVLEAWVCQNGEFVFRAFGTEEFGIRVIDEEGCQEQSRGQVAGAEIHGYTTWVPVPWP